MKIRVFEKVRNSGCGRPALIKAVATALKEEKCTDKGELNVVLVDGKEIKRLNEKYLGHNGTTDVIAFRYADDAHVAAAGADWPFGDIFICVPQAKRQAKELGHSLRKELLTLALHGTLHLLGYDDHKPKDRERMFRRQEQLLAGLT